MTSLASNIFQKNHAAFLFDMDGTLLNSIPIVERIWSEWAARQNIEADVLLKAVHGVRAVDSINALGLPGVDAVHEAAVLLQAEMEDVDGILPIAGVYDFLSALPADRWAIVTSAPRSLALRRLEAVNITPPPVTICGEDVSVGKPSPEGYRLAASKLGWDARDCVVFEDAAAGIVAGEMAGADVVVINATHTQPLETRHLSIGSYDDLRVATGPDGRLFLRRP